MKSFKSKFALLVVLALAGSLAGCTSSSNSPNPASTSDSNPPVTIRFSCPCVSGQPQTEAMTRFKKEVERKSHGAVQVELFPNGSLLSQNVEFEGLEKDSTDMAYADPELYTTPKLEGFQILVTPYLFSSDKQIISTFDSPDIQKIVKLSASQLNIRPLDTQNLGQRELNLNTTGKIRTPSDMKGIKLRMPAGPYWVTLGKALGGEVTPVAFNEIYLALQTGTVQAQDNPLPSDIASKFYEVTKQVVLTNHVFAVTMPAINEKVWHELSPSEQTIVVHAIKSADQWADNTVAAQQKEDIKFLKQHGLKVYTPDQKAFRSTVLKAFVCDPSYSKDFGPGLLKATEKIAGLKSAPSCK